MTNQIKEESDIFDFLEKNSPENKHRVFWAELYDKLLDDEARSIDNIMEKVTYRPGQIIYSQGAFDRNLYFFEAGQAKHIYTQHNREIFIKKIQPGSIAGEDTFFDGGCCTTTLVAMDQVKVRFMSAERLENEIRSFDILGGRLKNFCAKEVPIRDLLSQNAQDRRHHHRYSLQGSILIKEVDTVAGLDAKSLRGEIQDVSCGGLAILVKLENRAVAQALLGNNFKLLFNIPPKMTSIERISKVLGIRKQIDSVAFSEGNNNKYILNIKFSVLVEAEIITEYARYFKMMNDSHS